MGRRAVEHDCAIRDVLGRVSDAWSVLIITELGRGPNRFNALRRVVDGISQRMLTVTLRNLERDGIVSRKVLDLSPPQVEYALTTRGCSLIGALTHLTQWSEQNQKDIRSDRATYDEKHKLDSSSE
ncbi:winged helix-turn-helix transcriptional regulator [Epibacterium ulvae]|uniref:winged helix-turn-helix transcriptional regulator n=1 Tax=Epibacterium ulvae TaxID=1156985 RepID=UPI0024907077|nr:helix-turn-helix domain-containing protein [Epibacterium ulvae]